KVESTREKTVKAVDNDRETVDEIKVKNLSESLNKEELKTIKLI
ncbi:21224_t:CDS:1, partial [Gigaspora margarita]